MSAIPERADNKSVWEALWMDCGEKHSINYTQHGFRNQPQHDKGTHSLAAFKGLFILSESGSERNKRTRMHSSRMRTAHFSYHLGRGVYLEGGCLARGCVCLEGICKGGCLPRGGVCLEGVSARGGGSLQGQTPLWTKWLTDRCENITLPQMSLVGGNKQMRVKNKRKTSMKIFAFTSAFRRYEWVLSVHLHLYLVHSHSQKMVNPFLSYSYSYSSKWRTTIVLRNQNHNN